MKQTFAHEAVFRNRRKRHDQSDQVLSYQPAASQVVAPPQDDGIVYQLPARLRRQVVNYASREPPGTVIIDTANTYFYYILGNGQALRYGIGVAATGSPGPACSR